LVQTSSRSWLSCTYDSRFMLYFLISLRLKRFFDISKLMIRCDIFYYMLKYLQTN
jgi:hypothetical protein